MRPRAYRGTLTTASVSLDGVMVPLRPGEDGRAKASWREAACGTVSFHDAEGKRLKTLYLGRMPESGKLTLKAQLASEVAHIRRARPEIGIVAIADGAADNWTFLETLSPETEVYRLLACLRTSANRRPTMPWRPAGSRSTARYPDVTIPVASPR